jgi:arabinose-5-phosphate isomerase
MAYLHPDSNTSSDEVIAYGREILSAEAHALLEVSKILDSSFSWAVDIIINRAFSSRVVTVGIGKAGHIAQKVSATLSSIGISSFFLHAAEASHGDLGKIGHDDILLVFSHSGETSDVIRVLEAISHYNIFSIAITRNADSSLGQASSCTIAYGAVSEACPLNLAPTTSTTVMIALGDALCMCLLKRKGFTEEEFARFHPGGNLGKRLLKCGEIMRTGRSHCVLSELLSVREVYIRYSAANRAGSATLVNADGKLTGIFTDSDLRRGLLRGGSEFLDQQVSSVMTKNPRTVLPSSSALEAFSLIRSFKWDQVIVAGPDLLPVGLIDVQDLLRIFEST